MSRVLQSYGEDFGVVCAKCANAMWRTTKEALREDVSDDVQTGSADPKRKFAPWCMLSHAYIITEFDDCDGYLPEEEPKL